MGEDQRLQIHNTVFEIERALKENGIRVYTDIRDSPPL